MWALEFAEEGKPVEIAIEMLTPPFGLSAEELTVAADRLSLVAEGLRPSG